MVGTVAVMTALLGCMDMDTLPLVALILSLLGSGALASVLANQARGSTSQESS